MASFGSFETDREVYSGPSYTVYSARKAGDPKTEYAIKVFCLLPTGLDAASATDLAPLISDIEQSCVERVALQQRAAAASQFISPIFETGHDERGVWYATGFYPRSVNKIISGRVALNREALEHIIRAIAQGALDIKRTCGRSHGDILPSNVQISRSETLAEAKVMLSDPLPGDRTEAQRYELSDLHSIGRILLQLVLQREISQEDTLILPILTSREWTLFRKDADRWLSLCNRLLDPNLSLDDYSLEKLAADLALLEPKTPISRRMVLTAAAVIATLGVIGVFLVRHFNHGYLLVITDPPGAEIKLEVNGKHRSLGKTPTDGTPLKIKLRKGIHKLRAEYGDLKERIDDVTIKGSETRKHEVVFAYGQVKITSDPSDAVVKWEGKEVGRTPYTNLALNPGPRIFKVSSDGYEESELKIQVPPNQKMTNLHAKLSQVPQNYVVVDFSSQPAGAKIMEGTNDLGTADPDLRKGLPPGPHTITARFEDWPPVGTNVNIVAGGNPSVNFYLPHGWVIIDLKPDEAEILINNKSIGRARRKVLPPGNHAVRVEHPGYDRYTTNITIAEGKTFPLRPVLKADAKTRYDVAMKEGKAAFVRKEYVRAAAQANEALKIKPGDESATQLKTDAERQIEAMKAAQEQEQKYQAALQEGRAAFDRKEYARAAAQANEALKIKPGDEAAMRLKSDAEGQIGAMKVTEEKEQKYQAALQEGRDAFGRKDFINAAVHANEALKTKPGDEAAMQLMRQADLAQATKHFTQGEYSQALELCSKHDLPAFAELNTDVKAEQKAYNDASAQYSSGDYSFIASLGKQEYSGKSQIQNLLKVAKAEQVVFNKLESLVTNSANWSQVNSILADRNNGFVNKVGFQKFHTWKVQKDPVSKLNDRLEVFRVWFDLRRPDNKIIDPYTNKPAKRLELGIEVPFYRQQLEKLEADYQRNRVPESNYINAIKAINDKMDKWRN